MVLTAALLLLTMLPSSADDRVYVDFYVNGVQHEQVLVVLRGDDVLVPFNDLQAAGVSVKASQAQMLHQIPYVSLASLESLLTYRFDTKSLRLDITLVASALKRSSLDLSPSAPTGLVQASARGLALNYGLHESPGTSWTGSAEQRYSLANAAVVDNTIGRSIDGRLSRGLTDMTFDDAPKMRRTIVGDSFIGGGDLGGSAILGGMSVRRAFDMNPYAITFPLPSIDATVVQPSQAQIVVNGSVVKTIDLPPGRYNLDDLPIRSGIDRAQVVLRDAFGSQMLYDATLYGAAGLLRKGLTDYSYAVGMERDNPESFGDTYGPAAALARYRVGLSSYTTAGARFESSGDMWSGGFDYDGILRYADVHVALGRSNSGGLAGSAATIGYSAQGVQSSYSLVAQLQSAAYTNLSERLQDDRPVVEIAATATRRLLSDTSIALSLQYAHYRDTGIFREMSGTVTERVGALNVSLGYAGTRSTSGNGALRSAVSLLVGVPVSGTTVQMTDLEAGSSPSATTSIVHSPSSPLQTAYDVTLGAGTGLPVSGSVQFGLPFATVGVQGYGDLRGSVPFAAGVDLDGAVERIDGRTFFSQPIRDSYALVEAPGAGNALVYLDNRYVGHTNRGGYALVPFLASYQANRLSVSDAGFSLDQTLSGEDQVLAPTYRGAGIVRYQNHVEHGVVGRVVHRGGKPIAFGEAEVRAPNHKGYSSPTDETGRFYFEDLPAGSYDLEVSDNVGSCRARLIVPTFFGMQYSVGVLVCGE